MKEKINIAVLYGGNSSEYDISVQSAENLINSLDHEKYTVYKVLIKNNEWTATNEHNKNQAVDKNDFSINGQKMDIVYPMIHGTPGEDGLLQGYFQAMSIPFAGSDVLCSSLTFNKYFCNQFLRNYDLNIAASVLLKKGEPYSSAPILDKIGLPCFVKPNEGGSSFGISKVKSIEDFDKAVNHAFTESDQVIAEQFIEGTEITCSLFKTKEKEYRYAPAEIVSKNEFFDYQAKYDSDYNEEIVPARINKSLTEQVQKMSSEIYSILNCSGIVRIDYILKDNEYYFLEVNTIPGMTAESIVPKMFEEAGMNFGEAADLIIEDVLKK
ncbi:MAG: D-alanine--D-alanine ligase [Bacteroidota bacterium]|nr:D-alanine--D-alanine ligase [Bacteroidota bacterium]